MRDVKSYTYKLSPIINDPNLVSMLSKHKKSKAKLNREYQEFIKLHARKYHGFEHRILRNPGLLSELPDDRNLLRLYAKKVRRALNLLFARKNRVNDGLYHLRRRNDYICNLTEPLSARKKEGLLKYYEQDLVAMQEVTAFIEKYGLNERPVPEFTDLRKVLAAGNLPEISKSFKFRISSFNELRNLLKAWIWTIKQLLDRIRKKIKLKRYPAQVRKVQEDIARKVDYNFFLNKWMANHFILSNYDLRSIGEIRAFRGPNGRKVGKSAEWKLLYDKLRCGFESTTKTVEILNSRLGTPLHLEDRAVRNSLTLAADALKSQEKRLKLLQQVHDHFTKNLEELKSFIKDQKYPAGLFKVINAEKYFFIDNVLKQYVNALKTFMIIVRSRPINEETPQEVHSYFEKVFERQFHRLLDLFLAHPITERMLDKLKESKRSYKLTAETLQVAKSVREIIESELDQVNFVEFLKNAKHVNLSASEAQAFERFLRWSLSTSFLVNKAKRQAEDLMQVPSLEILERFKTHHFFVEAPLINRDVILFHGDDGKRRFDEEWQAPKRSGTISEILDFNLQPAEKMKFRLKLLDSDEIWCFHEFTSACPELHLWFEFNDRIKRFLGEILLSMKHVQVDGHFLRNSGALPSLDVRFEAIFKNHERFITDDFHAGMFRQLKTLILERLEEYRETPGPKTCEKFYSLFLEKLDAGTLHGLLKDELKQMDVADFGKNAQVKIKRLNPEGKSLEKINILRLKKVFLAHPQECPAAINEKFKYYKLKDFIVQRKHALLKRRKKLLISVPIEVLIPVTRNNSKRIVGLDWGVRSLLSASIFDYDQLEFVEGIQLDDFEVWEKVMNSRDNTARLQRIKAQSDRGLLKKGRFFRPYSEQITCLGLKNKERLKRIAHSVTTALVRWSVKNDAKILAVESLKSLRLERGRFSRLLNFKISNSPRSLIVQHLKMKISRFGGKLYSINPKHTSQYSSALILEALKSNGKYETWHADTEKGIRTNSITRSPPPEEKGGEYFYHDSAPIINADINAAQNVALKLFHHFE